MPFTAPVITVSHLLVAPDGEVPGLLELDPGQAERVLLRGELEVQHRLGVLLDRALVWCSIGERAGV